jgi:DNA helicase-2/ATP-dependent DNA helicase PcrA
VPVVTFHDWARRMRTNLLRDLPSEYTDETPDVVVRLKKHPAWLPMVDEYIAARVAKFEDRLRELAGADAGAVLAGFGESKGKALAQRARRLLGWLGQQGQRLPGATRHTIERETRALLEASDVSTIWAEMLTDRQGLFAALSRLAPGEFTEGQIGACFRWCTARCSAALSELEEREERRAARARNDAPDDFQLGVDGNDERTAAALDWEDDALLLHIYQRARGPLKRKSDVLRYEHIFVDEAQDLSPLEMSTVLATTRGNSVTLAGDVAQRLMMDNGFDNWRGVLDQLGKGHVEVEPLQVTYRSTVQIMELANSVLGHLLPEQPGQATRQGVPVELFRFSHTGDAVGFLAESLRALLGAEPMASVAVITRTLEQAREYADGLTRAEVPNVRLIAEQDFPFKAGIDVTDVRQVKGLEFDYVVLVEVTASTYPDTDEARHLLHIAATRAAHQLWITTTERPSPLLPQELCERGY